MSEEIHNIESVLEFSVGELERRKGELKDIGSIEIRARLKRYEVQPWNFIVYMAFNYPEQFTRIAHSYEGYDGVLEHRKLMDGVKAYHVLSTMLAENGENKGVRTAS